MAEAGLFIGWGAPVRGRESKGLDVFGESIQYWGRLQQEGRIESFEVALLYPHGGDLGGFALLRGSHAQLNDVGGDEEFLRLTARAGLMVESLGIVRAVLADGLEQQIAFFRDAVGELTQTRLQSPALDGGLVDELTIVVAPVILGAGKRLFEDFSRSLDLEHIGVRQSRYATFGEYRVSAPAAA